MTMEIQSNALYPNEGTVHVSRLDHRGTPIYTWPLLKQGDTLRITDNQGWIWTASIEDLKDADHFTGKVIGEKEASPLPQIRDGVLSLPAISGHAHARFWDKGAVVRVHGAFYKVTKVKYVQTTGRNLFTLEAATEDHYKKRPGKVKINQYQAGSVIGSAIEVDGEWLQVKKVTYTTFGSAAGGGRTYWAKGNFIPEARAKALNEVQPHILERDLDNASSTRITEAMPSDAVVLTPKNLTSLAATGTRVAVVGKAIWFEKVGDPDRLDSWYHYVVRIEDKDLLKRVQKFIKKTKTS